MRAYPAAGPPWGAGRARRLLFVRPGRKVPTAPIYVAILLLVSLSVIGFAAALWHQDSAWRGYQPDRPDRRAAASPGRLSDGRLLLPSDPGGGENRWRWM